MNIYAYLYKHPSFDTDVSINLAVPPEVDPAEAMGFEAWASPEKGWIMDDDPTRIIHPIVGWQLIGTVG